MSDNLSLKQDKAVNLLVSGVSQDGVANNVGVSTRTLRRWLSQPHFMTAMLYQRQCLRGEAVNRLHTEAVKAAETVISIMESEKVSPRTRLDAARDVLDRVCHQQEIDQLTAKIAELENLINERQSF